MKSLQPESLHIMQSTSLQVICYCYCCEYVLILEGREGYWSAHSLSLQFCSFSHKLCHVTLPGPPSGKTVCILKCKTKILSLKIEEISCPLRLRSSGQNCFYSVKKVDTDFLANSFVYLKDEDLSFALAHFRIMLKLLLCHLPYN